MIIRTCLECNQYKYIEKDGICRKCYQKTNNTLNSSGQLPHRKLIKKSSDVFTKLGFTTEMNTKTNNPDVLAKSPIKNKPIHNIKKQKNKKIFTLFGTKNVELNIETSTLVKPSNIINKLKASDKRDNFCLFIVYGNNNDIIRNAKSIQRIVRKNPHITNEWFALIYPENKSNFKSYKNGRLKPFELNKYI